MKPGAFWECFSCKVILIELSSVIFQNFAVSHLGNYELVVCGLIRLI